MWSIVGAMRGVVGSNWAEQELCGLLQLSYGLHMHYVGCCKLYVGCFILCVGYCMRYGGYYKLQVGYAGTMWDAATST